MAFSPNSSIDSPKLCQDIFAILESQFLFGSSSPAPVAKPSPPPATSPSSGKVRILSIDGGNSGDLAAASLVHLESSLRQLSGDSSTSLSDYFDLVVGSGSGGILASLIFANDLSASDASAVLKEIRAEKSKFGGLFKKESKSRVIERVFGEATMKDASKPLLVTCYDSSSNSPFVFSRADAVEADAFDFKIRDVCAAAACDYKKGKKEVRSVDGETRIRVTDLNSVINPTAVGITHVLHNKQEFPFVTGLEDLFVLSIGSTGSDTRPGNPASIAGSCQADTTDQAAAMAFGESRRSNYIRIQGNGINSGSSSSTADDVLSENCVESVMFEGKRVLKETNGDRLEWAASELVREQQSRRRSKIPVVFVKPAVMSPRTSSSSSSEMTATTALTGSSSESPRC